MVYYSKVGLYSMDICQIVIVLKFIYYNQSKAIYEIQG